MDSKEQIYNTSEEAAPDGRLKDLLAEAYPDPKGKIAASVMAQIRAEREAEEKQIRSDKAAARRRKQGLFMKWGGMAACMMILCGALVIAAPLMNRTDSMAADAPADAPEEAQVLADASVQAYSGVMDGAAAETREETYTYTADEEVTEDAVMTKSAPVKQAAQTEADAGAENGAAQEKVMYTVCTFSADAAAEEGTETAEDKEAFLQKLFDRGLLTEEKYDAWMQTSGYTGADDWTIGELCAFFGIETE